MEVKIIADSLSPEGIRITTFELEYPRFIHSELMTHRVFSRNAASSRAIPISKVIDQVFNNPAMPVHWGKNQTGMQAKEELQGADRDAAIATWNIAAQQACQVAAALSELGLHKQVANRILEPFVNIKVVVTSTEYENFFWLRYHPDAQPEIKKLATMMYEAREKSEPFDLVSGDWHVPYFKEGYWIPEMGGLGEPLEDALAISASCCAQVSYRKLDDSLEKAKEIYKRLVEMKPVHASPFEHQAKPMSKARNILVPVWEIGVTHSDKNGWFWSGNLKGWVQNRQLIPDNVFTEEFHPEETK